jgi:hypothetical protein
MTTPSKLTGVAGFRIAARHARAYTITDAVCICGREGYDKCPPCRKKEQDRIAILDSLPGGHERDQGGGLH